MSKTRKKRRIYSEEFKRDAVERMSQCESVVGLAKELKIPWRFLYRWKDVLEGEKKAAAGQTASREQALQQEVGQLKEALAEQILQTRLFRGALQRIEARRQNNNAVGKRASTTKSGK